MKKIRILAALFLCACIVCVSLSGCASTLWAMKTNKITVPTGVYLYYLLNERSAIQSGDLGDSSITSSGTSSDPWSNKIDKKNAADWAAQKAQKETRELLATEALCAEKKITLTSDEKSTVSSQADNMISTYPIFNSNGIAKSSLERVLAYNTYLKDKLFQSYYGTNGSKAVSDNDLKNYYTNHFVQVKQIFFNIKDDSGNALTSAQQSDKEKKAKDIMGQVSSDRSNFDSLMNANTEDPGVKEYPSGYIFGQSESYVKEFKNAAFAMKVGDVRLVKSSLGYHVLYKVQLDACQFDSKKSDVLTDMKNSEFLKMLDNYKGISVNNSTIGRYKPQKLVTDESSSEATT